MAYLYLSCAICAEVCATLALPHVTKNQLSPLAVVIPGYIAAFIFLHLALQGMTLAAAYAIWSGAGILLVALGGWLILKQSIDARALAGMAFIAIGIALVKAAEI